MPSAEYMREYRRKQKEKELAARRGKNAAAKRKSRSKQAAAKKPTPKPKAKPKSKPKPTVSKPKKRTTSKSGPRSKDAAITDNFSTKKTIEPSKADIAAARELLGLQKGSSEEQDAYKMLQNMRYVFDKAGGRSKLLKLIKKEDKQFMTLSKDLMKVEVALLTAQIRKEGTAKGADTPNQQNFFVVLKGLEQEKPLLEGIEKGDGTVDFKQIQSAIDPSKVTYVDTLSDVQQPGARSGDAPEELTGGLGDEPEPEEDPFEGAEIVGGDDPFEGA